jgi:hypothetical protein
MFTEVWSYIYALVSNWAGLISGALFVTDVVPLMLRKDQYSAVSDWLDRHVASEELRVPAIRTLLVVALLVAGFIAWDEQYHLAIRQKSTGIDERVARLEGSVITLSANYSSFVKGTAQRIPTQAQGAEAVRRQALILASNMMSYATTQEAVLEQIQSTLSKPPYYSRYVSAKNSSGELGFQMSVREEFSNNYGSRVQGLIDVFKANGVSLSHPDAFYVNPGSVDEIRAVAADLTIAANKLP